MAKKSYCHNKSVLRHLRVFIKKKKLLRKKKINKCIFKTIVEILRNSLRKRFEHCFNSKTKKELKKYKKTIRHLFHRGKTTKKRKKAFDEASMSFKRSVQNILEDFWNNCIKH